MWLLQTFVQNIFKHSFVFSHVQLGGCILQYDHYLYDLFLLINSRYLCLLFCDPFV